jgi:WD40 repeat protein
LAKFTLTPLRALLSLSLLAVLSAGLVLFVIFREQINSGMLSFLGGGFRFGAAREPDALSISLDKDPRNQYGLCNGKLAVLSPERLVLYNSAGAEAYSASIGMDDPVLRTGGNKAMVFDRGGQHLRIYGENGLEYALDEEAVLQAKLSEKDCWLAVTQESGYKGVVRVYNASNNEIFVWQSAQSGYITDADITPNGDKLAAAMVRQEREEVVARIVVYGTSKGELQTDISIPDGIVLSVSFFTGGNLCVFTENDVRVYSPHGALISSFGYANKTLLGAAVSAELCVFRTSKHSAGISGELTAFAPNGSVRLSIDTEEDVDDLCVAGGYTAVLSYGTLSLYNSGGNLIYSQVDTEVRRVLVTQSGALLLITQSIAYWLK